MSAASNAPSTPASRRDLRSPYFVFRTHDGLGTYFTSEHLPVIKSPKEPLSRFLAGARLVDSAGQRSLQYDYEEFALEGLRPMEFLPQSEIDAFAEAVREFYAKAHEATPRIVPHEKRLRAHFKLPDPDLEPDAYWVYGPAHDRKLLILWGCEFKSGTSLPLAPDAELKITAGRTILDRLQARVMSWESRQKEATKIALRADEPISRFLAQPAVDAAGQSVGVVHQGQSIPAKALKPLKRVLSSEVSAFEAAAKKFYDKAAPETAGITAYEKELRRAFRLPDPDRRAPAYLLHGKRLLVVLSPQETRDTTLPMVDHPALAPATPAAPTDGSVVVPAAGISAPNVAAKLRTRAVSAGLVYMIVGAAAALLVLGGLAAWHFLPDRQPPTLEKFDRKANLEVGTPSATQVRLRFSEPLAAASLTPAAFRFGDEKAKLESTPAIDPQDPAVVILTTSRLIDGEKYELVVRDVADRAGNKLAAPVPLSFEFFDTIAPKITTISGGPNKNQLTLVFSKPLRPETVSIARNFQLETADGTALRLRSAALDPTIKAGTHVVLDADKDFTDGLPYRLVAISGVKDTAKQGNYVELPKPVDFEYKDIMPPRILEAAGSAGRLEVTLTFSKPVAKDKAGRDLAENVANYTLTAPDGTALSLVPGSARFNEQGNVLKLRFDEPTKLAAGRYQIAAANLKDAKGNVIEPAPTAFEFFDMNDRSPLTATATGKITGNQLKVEFNRVLRRSDAANRAKFELLDDQLRPLRDIAIAQTQRVPDSPTQVLITFSRDPKPGSIIQVSATGVTDIFGNENPQPVRLAKPVSVSGVSAAGEQVLAWIGRPTLKGRTVTLSIKEEVSKASAQNLDNYEFTSDSVQLERVSGFRVETDAKSGTRRTIVELTLRAPLISPAGVKLAVRNLEAEGLAFLGAQHLEAQELVPAQ